ncbi:hypothetical protein [Pseudomonas fluorescens]
MASAIDKLHEMGVHRYGALPDEQKRAVAVAAALEVITSTVNASEDRALLGIEMNNLSKYADQIQEALKVK